MSTKDSLDEEFKKSLECPVCLEAYKQPKNMQCGHSICAACEARLMAQREGLLLYCPVCREPMIMSTNGLPVNYTLVDVLKHIERQRENGPKRHLCSGCDKEKPIDDFFLCQSRPEQEGKSHVVCSVCAIKLYKHTDLTQLSEVFATHKVAAAEFAVKMADKVEQMNSFETETETLSLFGEFEELKTFTSDVLDLLRRVLDKLKQRSDELNERVNELGNRDKSWMIKLNANYIGVEVKENRVIEAMERLINEQIARQKKFKTVVTSMTTTVATTLHDSLRQLEDVVPSGAADTDNHIVSNITQPITDVGIEQPVQDTQNNSQRKSARKRKRLTRS